MTSQPEIRQRARKAAITTPIDQCKFFWAARWVGCNSQQLYYRCGSVISRAGDGHQSPPLTAIEYELGNTDVLTPV